jgi:hypothetical protein
MDSETTKRVMDTVWPWKAAAAGVAAAPKKSNLVPGLVQAGVMAAIGFVLFKLFGHRTMAYVVWGLAAVVLGSALFVPPVFAAIEGFGKKLGVWVGTGLTYLLLVPFFYLVFVPGRLVMALLGKDPMKREFPAKEASCWSPRRTKMDEAHYRKQFS